MSEKLQSISKETIQVTPKEVVLPPVATTSGAISEQNGFLTELRGEQLPPDGKSDHENEEIGQNAPQKANFDESHIPKVENTIEQTDDPKTAFVTNLIIEQNSDTEVLPNSSNNIELNIDKEPNDLSEPTELFESNDSDHLGFGPETQIKQTNISDDDSDFGDFESEIPVSQDDFNEMKENTTANEENNVIFTEPKTENEANMFETDHHQIEPKVSITHHLKIICFPHQAGDRN